MPAGPQGRARSRTCAHRAEALACRPGFSEPPRPSAQTTSAACCDRPRCSRRGRTFKEGLIDAQELRGIEHEAIRDVVRKQEEVGLQSADFADQEFNRRADCSSAAGSLRSPRCRSRSEGCCIEKHWAASAGEHRASRPGRVDNALTSSCRRPSTGGRSAPGCTADDDAQLGHFYLVDRWRALPPTPPRSCRLTCQGRGRPSSSRCRDCRNAGTPPEPLSEAAHARRSTTAWLCRHG